MFSNSRKQAQQTAQQLIAGHCTLIVWWTLRHAGVLQAMEALEADEKQSLDPSLHATRTNMSAEVLEAMLKYLADAGLVAFKKDGVRLTAEGNALLENEDGTLGLIKAYQPVLDMAEHLLAKLKSYAPAVAATGTGNGAGGVSRKAEYLLDSQAQRYAPEVFPAIAEAIAEQKRTHLLDLTCGSGDLLVHVATRFKAVVGVGIGPDGIASRSANRAIDQAKLDKRLIAVTANPFDACVDTQRTFDRIGISRQLWKELDCLLAVNLFSEFTSRPEEITRILAAIPRSFPNCTLLLAEPVASPRFDRNYFSSQMTLLLRLARSAPLPAETWHELIKAAKLRVVSETPLNTDGLNIFICRPG